MHFRNRVAISLSIILVSVSAFSQEVKPKAKRDQSKIIDLDLQKNENFKELGTLLENRRFVFEAEYLQVQNKLKEPVSSVYDYITVDGSIFSMKMYNEFAPHVTYLGGIITDWELTKNERKLNYSLKFKVVSMKKFYEIYITININSDNWATAYVISTNFLGINIVYNGRVFRIEDSEILKARVNSDRLSSARTSCSEWD